MIDDKLERDNLKKDILAYLGSVKKIQDFAIFDILEYS
jgi:hypothetical protein